MIKDDEQEYISEPVDESEEIEILEIVGVDDDAPPSADAEDDDVEIVFTDQPGEQEPGEIEQAASESDDASVSRESFLRLQAEFENLKKRSAREKEDFYKHATSSLAGRLLPVIDNLERALATESQENGDQGFREGVALIYRQFMDELRKEGLRPIEALGKAFDPSEHEAVATESTTETEQNMVMEEFQKGYFFQDRLLRPALVKVNVGVPETGDDESDLE